MLAPRNDRLLTTLEPFLVATSENLPHFDRAPFGMAIPPEHCLDPLRLASSPFVELLCHLDAATFGPGGMPMPRWIFFDGGAVSGGVVGFGRRAADLSVRARELLQVPPDYRGLVPFSMYIAIPTIDPATWIGHNLCSVAGHLRDEQLGGLGSLTKAVALKVLQARVQIGASQWDSVALHVHAKLGPLRIVTAWTPAHTKPWTLTYSAAIDDAALRHLAGDPRGRVTMSEPDFWLVSDDHAAMQDLQARIERGERFRMVGPPERSDGDGQRVPIARERR
jgi:hypothetical protein